jgi:hypothetical protein
VRREEEEQSRCREEELRERTVKLAIHDSGFFSQP